jgi:hypothetical protein
VRRRIADLNLKTKTPVCVRGVFISLAQGDQRAMGLQSLGSYAG